MREEVETIPQRGGLSSLLPAAPRETAVTHSCRTEDEFSLWVLPSQPTLLGGHHPSDV